VSCYHVSGHICHVIYTFFSKTFLFLGYVLLKNYLYLEKYYNFAYSQMFWRSVIFWIFCLIFRSLSQFGSLLLKAMSLFEMDKSKNGKKSVTSHCLAIKRWKEMFSNWPIVFQVVRYRRRSIVREVQVPLVISISLLHQQSDNSCKIQHENIKWSPVFIYVGCHILSLASDVTREWIDVTVCLNRDLSPLRYPLVVQVGLVSPYSQKYHLCCHGHPQLTGPL
jgi:hypothetical protein